MSQYGKDEGELKTDFRFDKGEILRQIRYKQSSRHLKEVKFYTNRKVSIKYGKGDSKMHWQIMEGTETSPIVGIVSLVTSSPRIGNVVRCAL